MIVFISVTLLDFESHGYSILATTNFLTDRFRAVRQDLVIQQMPPDFAVSLLKKIVRYHILLRGLLYQAPIQEFDPVLNEQLLRSYLSDLFEFADQILTDTNDNFDEFEAYRLLLNFNDEAFVTRTMAECLQNRPVFRISAPTSRCEHACAVYLSLFRKNYTRFFKMCEKGFNFLESCCLLEMFALVRVEFLNRLCLAYNNKHLKFNLDIFAKWLSFDAPQQAVQFLRYFQVKTDEFDRNIIFHEKKTFAFRSTIERLDLIKQFTYKKLIGTKKEDQMLASLVNGCK